MDPVSRLLEDLRRRRPRLTPWVVCAVILHAGVASAVWWASQSGHHTMTQLPAVSVRLVQPELPDRPEGGGSPRRPSPTRPTPAPTPVATAAAPTPMPTAAVRPTAAPAPPPSDDAMPDLEATAVAAPTATPAAGGGDGELSRGGLSVGASEGRGGASDGLPSDFQFTYYIQRMLALIESHWYKPPAPPATRARVRFTIQTSGAVTGIQLEQSSGLPAFDRAALRALYATNPLPPLPPAYRKPSVTVHLSFSE